MFTTRWGTHMTARKQIRRIGIMESRVTKRKEREEEEEEIKLEHPTPNKRDFLKIKFYDEEVEGFDFFLFAATVKATEREREKKKTIKERERETMNSCAASGLSPGAFPGSSGIPETHYYVGMERQKCALSFHCSRSRSTVYYYFPQVRSRFFFSSPRFVCPCLSSLPHPFIFLRVNGSRKA